MRPDGLSHPAADAIAHHGLTHCAGDRKADPRSCGLGRPQAKCREERARKSDAVIVDSSEFLWTQQADTFRETCDGNYLSELTVSFFLPRARRRARTARPFFVAMRVRKPWVFARWRLLG